VAGAEALLRLRDRQLEAAYGPYYKVARAFVRMIIAIPSHETLRRHRDALGLADELDAQDHGQPHAARRDSGPAEAAYRALALIARLVP
jgi:hypothetical protein